MFDNPLFAQFVAVLLACGAYLWGQYQERLRWLKKINHDPCVLKAEPGEPRFTLLARDESAPELVEQWARTREKRDGYQTRKTREALIRVVEMREWRKENRP